MSIIGTVASVDNTIIRCLSYSLGLYMWLDLSLWNFLWKSSLMHIWYYRANPPASFSPIMRFNLKPERFHCDHATKRNYGNAMHVYSISVYYMCTGSQLIWLGWSRVNWAQRSSDCRKLTLITRAASPSMPKKLKTWVNINSTMNLAVSR